MPAMLGLTITENIGLVYYSEIVPLCDGNPPKFNFENAKLMTEKMNEYKLRINKCAIESR